MISLIKDIKKAAVASVMLATAASCHWGGTCYHRYSPVGDGWSREDTVSFHLPQLEAGSAYRLYVDVRHSEAYPYYDLWLLVQHNVADSLKMETDTLQCRLHDADGYPYGKGLTGLYEVEIPSLRVVADGSRSAVVRLSHCMEGGHVDGITDIGIRLGR